MSIWLIKRASFCAAALIAAIETTMAIAGFDISNLIPDGDCLPWYLRAACFAGLFLLLTIGFAVVIVVRSRRGVELDVRGNEVRIIIGDLFEQKGLKVIPFTDRFDTQVDDVRINHSSLNGQYIERCVPDLNSFIAELDKQKEFSSGKAVEENGELVYPLGTIKVYQDYGLLAFSKINALNESHLTMPVYESCLFGMWRELSRVYAGRPIVLPLLGSGVTRFDDLPEVSFDELLRCILCTLRSSNLEFIGGITIALTPHAAKKMKLYNVKGFMSCCGLS